MDFDSILLARKLEGGGGSSVDVESLSVTENGTYTAPTGKAYSPVNVNVSGGDNLYFDLKPVAFIDYDGTLLYNYDVDEFLAMDSLPPNPTHSGLVAQGWNWTLAEAKTFVSTYGCVCIGQNYDTDDKSTRIYVTIDDTILGNSLMLQIMVVSGTVTYDWGDGSPTQTTSGTGSKYFRHTYESTGNYVIKLTSDGSYELGYSGSNSSLTDSGQIGDGRASMSVTKIEVGSKCERFQRQSFASSKNLQSISIPRSVLHFGSGSYSLSMGDCLHLRGVVVPPNCELHGSNNSKNFPSTIDFLSLPPSYTDDFSNSPGYILSANTDKNLQDVAGSSYKTRYFAVGGTYTEIGRNFLNNVSMVKKTVVPSTVTSIADYAFNGFRGELHLLPTTPPTLANSRGVSGTRGIYVPYSEDHSILNAYKTATNWSNVANEIYEESA